MFNTIKEIEKITTAFMGCSKSAYYVDYDYNKNCNVVRYNYLSDEDDGHNGYKIYQSSLHYIARKTGFYGLNGNINQKFNRSLTSCANMDSRLRKGNQIKFLKDSSCRGLDALNKIKNDFDVK